MTTATREQIVDWMLYVDDPWELMRVNWGRHDPFTQNGMWDVSDTTIVRGIRLVMDNHNGFRGYLLELFETDTEAPSWMAIAVYAERCQECDATPHDSMFFGDGGKPRMVPLEDAQEADTWAIGVIHGMWENASNGYTGKHLAHCSHYNEDPEFVDPTGFPFAADSLGDLDATSA